MNTIKQIITSLFIIILFISSTHAQSSTAFGAKLGWVNSGFLGEDTNNQDKKPGMNAGLFLNITSDNGIIGFQPEVLYTLKSSSFQAAKLKEEYKLSYLKTPLLLKASVPISSFRPNVFAGPYASFKLDETYTYTDLLTGVSVEESNNTKSIDYGIVFGGGIDFDLGSVLLTSDVRYDLGLQELEDVEEPKDVRNGDFSVNVGVAFKL